ncbi:MAG: peroxidase family protein [Jannaschia sp.]
MPRLTEARYQDALGALYQGADPMEVAQKIFDQEASTPAASGISTLFTTWGQFLDHDLSLTPEGDTEIMENPAFAHGVGRSEVLEGSGIDDPRAFGNSITWQIDGSMIYGSNDGRTADVRSFADGKLKMIEDPSSTFGLLPQATPETVMAGDTDGEDAVFLAGDIRANENPNLLTMHTLFAREHNYWAEKLAEEHPDWDDEQLFAGARQIVEFEIQKITYQEWLPLLVGNVIPDDIEHDPDADGQVALEFSTAAFRFGHTLVASQLDRTNDDGTEAEGGHQALMDAFFNPDMVREHGIDAYLRGMTGQAAEELDTKVVDDLNFFLQTPDGVSGFSLPALNLMRAADHGMDSYVNVRAQLMGDIDPTTLDPTDFSIITSNTEVQAELASVYPDVRDVDLWVGGLAEDKIVGTMMGPLFTHIISDQFVRTASADETFGVLDPALGSDIIAAVNASGMRDVILRNSYVDHMQDDPFLMATRTLTEMIGPMGTSADETASFAAVDVAGKIVMGGGDDTVTIIGGSVLRDTLALGSGDDSLRMTSGAAKGGIDSGTGDDTIDIGGTATVNTVSGGGGDDIVRVGERAHVDVVETGKGDDLVELTEGATVGQILTGSGSDTVTVGRDAEVAFIDLGRGSDEAVLNGSGVTHIDGGSGIDALRLGPGARVVHDGPDGIVAWADGKTTRFENFEVVTCFTPGTRLITGAGKRQIETLRPGALVLTLDHGLQPVRWIGRTRVRARGRLAPVLMETGALGNSRRLSVSPQHRMVLASGLAEMMFGTQDVLAPAIALTGRAGISRQEGGTVDYIHILFDRHEIVLSEGIPSESFHPGVVALSTLDTATRSEISTLFPQIADVGYGPFARPGLRGREARLLAGLMS